MDHLAAYAPASRSRLVDHLRALGFDLTTMRNAGLGAVGADGRLVDRFRDQLMLPARDDRLQIVGFTGVRRSGAEVYHTSSPNTQIHRRSGSLIGIAEQLLAGGASPVLVDDPLDAFAIENVSRLSGGRWVGIPLCGALLSVEQSRILGIQAATDTILVLVSHDEAARQRAVECLPDLAKTFRRVQAVHLSRGFSPATRRMTNDGPQRLHDELLLTRPWPTTGCVASCASIGCAVPTRCRSSLSKAHRLNSDRRDRVLRPEIRGSGSGSRLRPSCVLVVPRSGGLSGSQTRSPGVLELNNLERTTSARHSGSCDK